MLAETFIILTVMFISVMGPSIVIAVLGYSVIRALSRNPSAASKIFMGMAIMLTDCGETLQLRSLCQERQRPGQRQVGLEHGVLVVLPVEAAEA